MSELEPERTATETPEAAAAYFDSFGLTDTGRVRAHNEDSFLCLAQHGVFCVADGMGGMRDGALASQTTVNCVEQAFAALTPEPEAPPPTFKQKRDTLVAALEEANRRMQLPPGAGKDRRRSGSTVVALLLDPDNPSTAISVHAGDSRLYRLRDGLLAQLTTDHSADAFLKGLSKHAKDSLLAAELKSVVTRGIGLGKELNQEEKRIKVRKDDVYLLCSDGLSNMLKAERIRDTLTQCTDTGGISAEKTCQLLIAAANDAGGHDNITVIAVHITADLPDAATATTAFSAETDVLTDTTAPIIEEPPSLLDKYGQLFWSANTRPRDLLLAAGIGVCVIISIGLLVLKRPSLDDNSNSPEPEQKVIPPPGAIQKPLNPEDRLRLLDALESEFKATLISGNWNMLQERIDNAFQNGSLLPEDRSQALIRRIGSWYALWRDASGTDQKLAQKLAEATDTHSEALVQIGSETGIVAAEIDWPPQPDAAAAVFCAETSRIRQAVIRKIIEARDNALGELAARTEVVNKSEYAEKQEWLHNAESKRNILINTVAELLPIQNDPGLGPRKTEIPWSRLISAFLAVRDFAIPNSATPSPEPAQTVPAPSTDQLQTTPAVASGERSE